MQIRDKAPISTRKTLPNGDLLVDAVLARTGIQLYSAGELGLKDRAASDVIRVWRPAAEVFAQAAIDSFDSVALTDNHPSEDVDETNRPALEKGWVVGKPYRDGDLLKAQIVVSDSGVQNRLGGGKEELSNGYDADFDWTPGVVPAGERDAGKAYDAIQTNIIGNHVALVDAGRCGADCRIQDKAPDLHPAKDHASCSCHGDATMADKALTKKLIDGVGLVEATDEAFSVIDSLQTKLAEKIKAMDTAAGAADAAAAAAATTIADQAKQIETLTAQIGDTATLDARVAARATLVADARKIGGADLVVDGLTDAQIRKAAVTAKQGEEKVKDKSDAYFDGAFEFLAAEAVTDSAGDRQEQQEGGGLRDHLRQPVDDGRKTQSYEDKMASRWNKKVAA